MSMTDGTKYQNTVRALSYPDPSNHTRNQSHFLSLVQSFLIMIKSNSVYCHNLQELFWYPCNSEWKWFILAQFPAKSKKSCQILTNQNFSGPFPGTVLTKSSHSLLYHFLFFKMWNFNHRNLLPFLNCHIQKLIDTQQIFVPVYIATDFWLFTATFNMTFQLLKVIAVFLDENNLSSNLFIICSIYVFALMNIKGPIDVKTQYRNLLYP